jgi:hypothetical protein
MLGQWARPRSRTPNEPGGRDIAAALYPDVDGIDWIPSDDADVFRLTFTSDRSPGFSRWLPTESGSSGGRLPPFRRCAAWDPGVLQFEHTSDDLPDLGIDFHVTRELAHAQQASRALADLWTSQRARALDVTRWLGECTGRIESLDWRRVPRANSPNQRPG